MSEKNLRNHLREILEGRSVHCGIEEAVSNIPFECWGKRKKNLPYTLFELLEHIRLTNRDILEYIKKPDYEVKKWPDDYWPEKKKPQNEAEVEESIEVLKADIDEMLKLLKKDPLLEPLPYGSKKHTLAREVLILSNHIAYHLGQFILMRRLLGIW